MPNNKIQKLGISKVDKNNIQQTNDYLAVETPLEIRLTHDGDVFENLSITMFSPDGIYDFIYGYLLTEQIIYKNKDVISIEVFDNSFGLIAEIVIDKSINYKKHLNKRHGLVHASCGICGKTELDDLLTVEYTHIKTSTIDSQIIQSLPQKLNKVQSAFKKTGGLHGCALFDFDGRLLLAREDIGRHNALDKLIGAAFKQDLLPLSDCIILLSGRVSFELVHKSLIAGVSVLAAIGAPSSLSVEIAKINNLKLIGFVKDNKFNIY